VPLTGLTMLGDGVSFRGKSYRSLSEVAREITGSRWCQTHGRRLPRDSLSFAETIGQAVANIAPTLTPAINTSVVVGLSGIGAWLSYLIATVGLIFVAANIGVLARRHPLAGSYFVYIGRALG
jgi:DUF2924 family protein